MMEAIFGWIIKKIGETAFGKMIGDALEEKFPKLFKSKTKELEQKIDSSTSRVIEHLELVDEVKKEYKTNLEKSYQRRIDEAKTKLDTGKNETAKKEYEAILRDLNLETAKIDSHLYFRVHNNLGVCELNLGNIDRAAELFEKAYSFESDNPTGIANYALAKFFKDDAESGLSIVNELLEKKPQSTHAISVKANILHALKRYDELLPFLKEQGKTALLYWYEGFKLMDEKKFDDAMSSFEKLINLEPKNIKAYLLATQNVMVGTKEFVKENAFPSDKIPPVIRQKFTKAITWVKKAIELLQDEEQKSDLEMAYTNLSGCCVAIGLYEEAVDAAGKATAINSTSPIPFLNKGIAQLKTGKHKEAISSFQKYKELGGGDTDADRHIAFCSLRIGALDDAEKIITPLLENGEDLDIVELAVELYSRRLDDTKLESLLKKLEESYPDNPQALRIRANHLQRLGMTGAEALLQKALENSKTDSEKFLSEIDLADHLYNSKEFIKAAEIYEKYANTKETNPAAFRFAECLYNSGQYGNLLKWVKTLDDSIRNDNFIQQIEAYSNLYLGNLERAATLFKGLFERNPNNFRYLVYYGMCQFRLGKEEEAKKAYNAVKNRVSETADLAMLAGGYEFIGEWEVALELTYKALENDPNNPKAHLAYIFTFLRREQAEDEKFEDKYVKAFQKSIGEFNKRFPEEKALQSFEIKDKDISPMLEMADKLAESTENATGLYRESKVPLAVIPKFTNKKPFDVWAAFTQMPDVGIKISFGSPDEISTEAATVKEYQNNSIVIDIYPLFLLAHLNKLELLPKLFKKIYVHQSVIDELTESIDDRRISARKGQKIFGKIDGQHRLIDIPPEQIQKTVKLLESIRDFLSRDKACEIRGLSKEREVDEHNLINALHETTRDSVFLAEDLNLPLYCDDRILRVILRSEHNVKAFSTQPLINLAQTKGAISLEERFETQKEMIDFRYEFVSIDATFIYFFLKKEDYSLERVQNIITMLVRKETSIQSLGIVLADLLFILFTDQSIDSNKKLEMFRGIVSQAKPNHDLDSIEEGIFINLQQRVKPEKREQLKKMIRLFFSEL